MTLDDQTGIWVWNAGDMPTDFTLTVGKNTLNALTSNDFLLDTATEPIASFQKSVPVGFSFNTSLIFDSRLHLIYDDQGNIYNRYFSTEAFVQIPVAISTGMYMFRFQGTDLPASESENKIQYFYKFY